MVDTRKNLFKDNKNFIYHSNDSYVRFDKKHTSSLNKTQIERQKDYDTRNKRKYSAKPFTNSFDERDDV